MLANKPLFDALARASTTLGTGVGLTGSAIGFGFGGGGGGGGGSAISFTTRSGRDSVLVTRSCRGKNVTSTAQTTNRIARLRRMTR
jgi:hypothetical protein